MVFKLLSEPLKLLLSQLSKFCQDHISYTSLIIVLVSICDNSVALICDTDGN